jgi:osmotically inducible lipoprotein OsmB
MFDTLLDRRVQNSTLAESLLPGSVSTFSSELIMRKATAHVMTVIVLAVALAGCGQTRGTRAVTGGLIGAGGGAAVGAATGLGAGKGALIGGGVGAAGGALTGH